MKKLLTVLLSLIIAAALSMGGIETVYAQDTETDNISSSVSTGTDDSGQAYTGFPQYIGSSLVKLEAFNYEGVKIAECMETNLGDLVADSFRERTGADIAFVEAGEFNSNIQVGDIFDYDILKVLPYNKNVSVILLSGYDILDALEYAVMRYPSSNSNFLQVSGITFDIQQTVYPSVKLATNGNFESVEKDYRVTNIMINGEPISLFESYTLAATDEMISGTTGFTMLSNGKLVKQNLGTASDIVCAYITDNLKGTVGTSYQASKERIDAIKLARQSEIDKEISERIAIEMADMESITASLNAQIVNLKEIIAIKDMQLEVKSEFYKTGKTRKVKLTWEATEKVNDIRYEVFRSVKSNGGTGTKPYYTTSKTSYINSKGFTKGKTYYYKVRAVKYIDGQNYYSQWSGVTAQKITK